MTKIFKALTGVLLTGFLLLGLAVPGPAYALVGKPEVTAQAAILMDMKTGAVLYEKNADQIMEPASLTKIMTGLLAVELLDPATEVTIDRDFPESGNSLILRQGEVLTVEQLLYGMLVHSANDAAIVLAEEMAGSVEEFCKLADARAKEIGAVHSVFKNPNGRNDVTGHVTTARDLALISAEAMKNPLFRQIVGTDHYTIPATGKSPARSYDSTNRLLYDTETELTVGTQVRTPKYDGILGIKTGETTTAGLCLAAAAAQGDTELIAIVLDAPKGLFRFSDGIALLDYGFDNFYSYRVLSAGDSPGKAPVRRAASIKAAGIVPGDCWITLPAEASSSLLEQRIVWSEDLAAPLEKGSVLGTADYYLADKKIASFPLVAAKDVPKGGPWTLYGISDILAYILFGLALLLLAGTFILTGMRRKRRRILERKRRAEEARIRQAQEEELANKRRRDWPY